MDRLTKLMARTLYKATQRAEILEEVHYLIGGIIIPPISLGWLKVNLPSWRVIDLPNWNVFYSNQRLCSPDQKESNPP